VETVVDDVKRRTEGRPMRLITSDDYPASKVAIEDISNRNARNRPEIGYIPY